MLEKSSGLTAAMVIAAILVISVAISPLSFNNRVQAAAIKVAQGEGSGTVTCPNGSVFPNADFPTLTISFQGTKGVFPSPGKVSGSFELDSELDSQRFFLKKLGDFNQGTITKNEFSFSGTESSDNMCGASLPATVTISGPCGQGVAVRFQATNGEKGEMTANVVCVI
jgi:hypothetical protein